MRLFSWEKTTSRILDGIGLRSIKSKIIVFALTATLIPSLTTGWLSYKNNRRAIDEKIAQELTSLTSQSSREFDLWLRERHYEIKVLSSSYEVSENLELLNEPAEEDRRKRASLRRLQDYLGSVGGMFPDYDELIVLDREGNILADSTASLRAEGLRGPGPEDAPGDDLTAGHVYWDEALDAGVMIISEPIRRADDTHLGTMVAKVNFDKINEILSSQAKDPSHELYLVNAAGELLGSSRPLAGAFLAVHLEAATAARLFRDELAPLEFDNFRGVPVIGALRKIPEMGWGVVAEKDRATAYAAILRLRDVTLVLISGLLLAIGLTAYLLGLTIVGPLNRLTGGATKVAGGDLDVSLPLHGSSEVSYFTEVFNKMVGRLRGFRDEVAAINEELRARNEELRTLSVTDSLTGLYNRARLPEMLEKELARSKRHQRAFSVLMMDIDHFKKFNDAHGHQAGDDLLRRVAEILRSVLRACDVAARYGGEEFLVLVTEAGPEGALRFGEKLRASVEGIRTPGKKPVTVSIGVASYPEHGGEVEEIIRKADEALYRCKRRGRNRVALAEGGRREAAASPSR